MSPEVRALMFGSARATGQRFAARGFERPANIEASTVSIEERSLTLGASTRHFGFRSADG